MRKGILTMLLFTGCTINHYHYDCNSQIGKEEFRKQAKAFFPQSLRAQGFANDYVSGKIDCDEYLYLLKGEQELQQLTNCSK